MRPADDDETDNNDKNIKMAAEPRRRNETTKIFCLFTNWKNEFVYAKAAIYEMCENHGKPWGGE